MLILMNNSPESPFCSFFGKQAQNEAERLQHGRRLGDPGIPLQAASSGQSEFCLHFGTHSPTSPKSLVFLMQASSRSHMPPPSMHLLPIK